jgi:hypothetical protein
VIVIEACPMKAASVLAFTPAAIISDAKVWRQSCRPIGLSPAARHARSARWLTA